MKLSPAGREWYALEVTTTPVEVSWEATFDDGTTWEAFTPVGSDGYFRWLVAGPDATSNPAGTIELPLGRTIPRIRTTDNPEVIIRDAPPIDVQ